MKLKAEILTPVHIGSGEEITPAEYFIDKDKGKLIRLNMDKVFSDPAFSSFRTKFIAEAMRQRYIASILPSDLLKKYPLYVLPISPEARTQLTDRPINIRTFIKTAGRVFLPGSSLKGSILSALMWYTLKENPHRQINNYFSSSARDSKGIEKSYQELLSQTLSLVVKYGGQGRFTRWISVSDSQLEKPENCLQVSLAKVAGARGRGQIPLVYEALKPGVSFVVDISIIGARYSEQEILKICHDFYRRVAQLDSQCDRIDMPKEPYLLRLGQGSSAYSTSLLILAQDLGIRNYLMRPPRTRKRIDQNLPMGFARLGPA